MSIGESRREVRITWTGFAVIFTVIGSLLLYRGKWSYPYFLGAAAFFAFFAAFAPMALLPLYRVWTRFAAALAWFNTRVLLGLVFYLIITPVGLIMKIIGSDPMKRKIDKDTESYWIKRKENKDLSRYDNQY